MAAFTRLEVLNTILDTGLVPVFYYPDVEVAAKVAAAVAEGGCRLLEFTNRGDFAPQVFTELARRLAKSHPGLILGVGSIVDAPTAALYVNSAACFVVGPLLNPEVARFCNRRKVPYCPGCGTVSEISQAEELGVEICKIFPGETIGGPAFIKAVHGPMPWTRLMPTGGVEPTRESVSAWIKAGAAAVGIGGNLIRKDWLAAGDYAAISAKMAEVLGWIKEARQAK